MALKENQLGHEDIASIPQITKNTVCLLYEHALNAWEIKRRLREDFNTTLSLRQIHAIIMTNYEDIQPLNLLDLQEGELLYGDMRTARIELTKERRKKARATQLRIP